MMIIQAVWWPKTDRTPIESAWILNTSVTYLFHFITISLRTKQAFGLAFRLWMEYYYQQHKEVPNQKSIPQACLKDRGIEPWFLTVLLVSHQPPEALSSWEQAFVQAAFNNTISPVCCLLSVPDPPGANSCIEVHWSRVSLGLGSHSGIPNGF